MEPLLKMIEEEDIEEIQLTGLSIYAVVDSSVFYVPD